MNYLMEKIGNQLKKEYFIEKNEKGIYCVTSFLKNNHTNIFLSDTIKESLESLEKLKQNKNQIFEVKK